MPKIKYRWSSPSVVQSATADKRCFRDGVDNAPCDSSQVTEPTEPESGSHMSPGAVDSTPSTQQQGDNTSAHFSDLSLSEVRPPPPSPQARDLQSCQTFPNPSPEVQSDNKAPSPYQGPFIVSSDWRNMEDTRLPFSGMPLNSQGSSARAEMAGQANNQEVHAYYSMPYDNTSGVVQVDLMAAYQAGENQAAHQGHQQAPYSGGSAHPPAWPSQASITGAARMANASNYLANYLGSAAPQDDNSTKELQASYSNLGRFRLPMDSMSNATPGPSSAAANNQSQDYNSQMLLDKSAELNNMSRDAPHETIQQGFGQTVVNYDPFEVYNWQSYPANPAAFDGMRNHGTQGSNSQSIQGGQNASVPGPNNSSDNGNSNDIATNFMASAEAVIADGSRYSLPPKFGVLKITNIPYSVTKEEVICLMGRYARILPFELGYPIHIIMERSTAKTMDCFVEFVTPEDAMHTLEYVNDGLPGYPPRLGGRNVVVEASSQDELLHAMFPRAKCLRWINGVPHVMKNEDPYSTGYQGFFTQEEMFNVIRHAEFPRRAPFAEKCPQRIFESTISTLYKFPWYATTLYTIEDRNSLYRACRRQLVALDFSLRKKNTVGLNERLLNDLLIAGLRCPVFNERQKCSLFIAAQSEGIKKMPQSSKAWPFDSLIRKVGATEDEVQQFAQLMAHVSTKVKAGTKTLPNKWTPAEHSSSGMMFGKVWFEWSYGNTNHKFSDVVEHEMQILKGLVKSLANPTPKTPGKGKKKSKGRHA